ncbi:hypothetical protein H5410_007346 [Solanum commersonii]|uniref:Uncharacterized protein n=1 Tax=Solanum commersonii TaxID=4109 RepID=A0A9J6AC85_SOLCO|nr:hypothetical protein H5410_007346 [Solanum commersonii]
MINIFNSQIQQEGKGDDLNDPDYDNIGSIKIALLNGITMAGGAAISIPGTFRVATQKTVNENTRIKPGDNFFHVVNKFQLERRFQNSKITSLFRPFLECPCITFCKIYIVLDPLSSVSSSRILLLLLTIAMALEPKCWIISLKSILSLSDATYGIFLFLQRMLNQQYIEIEPVLCVCSALRRAQHHNLSKLAQDLMEYAYVKDLCASFREKEVTVDSAKKRKWRGKIPIDTYLIPFQWLNQ